MAIYQWLCLFGVPAIIASIYAYLKIQVKKVQAISLGVQAILRRDMRDDYEHFKKLGYAPLEDKDTFENCWKRYEALGANGVMQGVHDKFMALPDEPEAK